jgi:hypothetical protein
MRIYIHPHVAQIRELFSGIEPAVFLRETILRHLAALEAGYREKLPAVGVILRNFSPRHLSSAANSQVVPAATTEELRDVVAHYFGFAAFAEIDSGVTHDTEFERAVDYLLSGNVTALTEQIDRAPELLTRSSRYGHRAGLIHYLAANGVEMHHQVVPANAPELLSLLLERGADADQPHQIYGGRHDLRALIETSAHPAAAGVREALLDLLA